MQTLTIEALEGEKQRLSRKCANDKTCEELEETLRLLAIVRMEYERREIPFLKTR